MNILRLAVNIRNVEKIGRKVSFDKIKLPSEWLHSKELKEFLIEDCLAMLFVWMNGLSDSLGFPEVVHCCLEELRKIYEENCNNNFKDVVCEYEEDLKDLIGRVEKQVKIVDEKRKDFKFGSVMDVREFEKSIGKMIE